MNKMLITLVLSGLLLAGCTASGPNVRPDAETGDPSVLSDRGHYDQAARRWLEFAMQVQWSEPVQAAKARLAAAEAWLEAERVDQARLAITDLDDSGFSTEERFRLDLVQAALALLDGDFDTASLILSVPFDQVPESLRDRFGELSERLEFSDPDSIRVRIQRVRAAMQSGMFEPRMALDLLLEYPLTSIEQAERRAIGHDDDLALLPWLELARSGREYLLDDEARLRAFADWQRRYESLGWSAESAEQTVQRWKATRQRPAHVAVLLPGEGRLQRAGEVLRDGLVSAWLSLPESARPELSFYYLEDRPNAAVGALFSAQEQAVDAVIGPLDRRQINALLQLPDSGLPMLLLNRPIDESDGFRPARSISILALPPEEEAELAAVHALVEGHTRALVVAQRSDWGEQVSRRFIETFELGGGRVLTRVDYDDRSFDHTEQLEVLLQLDQSRQRIATLAGVLGTGFEAQPQRRTDAELIFLAAPDGDALQLMPQLRFLDADDLEVYATSHVYTGRGNSLDLQGIQFPAAPWLMADTEAGELRERVQIRFPDLTSITLSQLHALGRDAMALMPWLQEMKRDRRLYLAGHVGRLRLSDGMTFERDLPWARIGQGRIVQD